MVLLLVQMEIRFRGENIAGFSGNGIVINGDDNIIGVDGDNTNDATEPNYIYNNTKNGILINSGGDNNIIAGNTLGVIPTDSSSGPNILNGIQISGSNNRVGVLGNGISDTLEGNTIKNSGQDGIFITNNNNVIRGNTIYANTTNGINVFGCMGTKIGTDGNGNADTAEGNHIHFNSNYGIYLNATTETVIAGNRIGTNATGTAASRNDWGGIYTLNATVTTIGTDGDGPGASSEGNLISGNDDDGIYLNSSYGNVIAGNKIGTNASGTAAIGNYSGIVLDDSYFNTVGTNGDGVGDSIESNLISGNNFEGIYMLNDTYDNVIAGNKIGVNASGVAALPNKSNGIYIVGAAAEDNLIGTNADGTSDGYERNTISGNTKNGIFLKGDNNQVSGNYIGLDSSGMAALANGDYGIYVEDGYGNTIGTNGDGNGDSIEGNVISANLYGGIFIKQGLTTPTVPFNTKVFGNKIGTTSSGLTALPNLGPGVKIENAGNNAIGSSGVNKGNLIAYHGSNPGIVFSDVVAPYATGNTFLGNSMYGNSIGIDLKGDGVSINDANDTDSGPNNMQNFPGLTSVASTGDSLSVILSLNSIPEKSYSIDFYLSPTCHSSGFGEGKRYLGNTSIITGNTGNYSGQVAIPATIIDPGFITATATYAGSTSEFSQCIELEIEEVGYYLYLPLILH